MDLGIAGKTAIVCGGSKGLGKGCAMALAAEGVRLVINGRHADVLAATAAEIRDRCNGDVTTVAADVTTAAGRAAILGACADPDILVTNAGGPPAGDFRQWSEEHWQNALRANMVTHILLIKEVIDGMMRRRFGRIVNITSSAVKMPYPALGLSSGARAGLTGFIASLAREVVRHGVTVNNLLPGSHDTDRLRSLIGGDASRRGITLEAALAEAREAEAAKRFGTVEEFGAACAFLCGAQAGFITGQNLVLDGGTYPGIL